jgi:hypothetical protein
MPKFKSVDGKVTMESLDASTEDGTIIKIKRSDRFSETFVFDKENNQTVISYQKEPYTPLNIYKALLKIGLSVLGEEYLNHYKYAFEYLKTSKYDNSYSGFATATLFRMPFNFQYEQPTVMLFKKLDSSKMLFSHVMYFSALNFIFQIVIPLNQADSWFHHNNASIEVLWCPPLFGNSVRVPIFSTALNLNSTERLYKQNDSFIIPSQPGSYEKSRFHNKETGEVSEEDFDGSKIVGIDIIKIFNENPKT